MKSIIKSIISLLLTVAVFTGVAAVGTSAEDTNYHLWVGGIYVTRENAGDIVGGYTAKYDPGTNTLTLNNFTYEGYGSGWPYYDLTVAAAIIYDGERDFTVEIEGDNFVTQTGADISYGMFFNSNAIVTGTGNLTVKGRAGSQASYGLYAVNELTIKSGEINAAVEGESPKCAAICGTGVTITGGVVNATNSKNEWTAGIYSAKSYVQNGGVVSISGGISTDYSCGLYSREDVIITGGTLNAVGKNGGEFSDGIYAGGSFSMSGGVLNASGGPAVGYSDGLYIEGDAAYITGGTAVLSGGEAGKGSYGINEAWTSKKDISVGKGVSSVTLSGKTAAVYDAAVKIEACGVGYENEDGTGEKTFIPADTEAELNYKKAVFPHEHSLTKIDAKQPTNRETGNIEYYVCSGCDGYFKDADGKIYIEDKNSVIIPALGDEGLPEEKGGFPWIWVILSVALIVIAVVVAVIVIKKKRK